MPRRQHGATVSLETVRATFEAVNAFNRSAGAPIALAIPRRLTEFGYMFDDLQADPTNLLAEGPETIANLQLLGQTMIDFDPQSDGGNNGTIPAAYTYLGQFIDHDITLETLSDAFAVLDNPTVLTAKQVLERIKNQRTATLDLDSVYDHPAVFDGEKMKIGPVTGVGLPVPGKGPDNDLPRAEPDPDFPEFDRFALIGDERNDENLVVAQLHVAFLKAHNAIVNRGHNFNSAQRILRQLYQWIVVKDFLVKVVGQATVDKVLAGNRFFVPTDDKFFMPLEFAVAAFRFGHSMVRDEYDFNLNFRPGGLEGRGTLDLLFTFTALSGDAFGLPTLPQNWIIQWERFVAATPNPTRKIDTHLVSPLFHLTNESGIEHLGLKAKLATRNLLRGYKLRMPTGQAVATRMGAPLLAEADLLQVITENADNVGMADADKTTLLGAGFEKQTPLWYYILAESQLQENGEHLGIVGGTIVAEVLIEMVRRSADSFLELGDGWNPSQLSSQLEEPITSEFDLSDLLKLAGVL